MLVPGKTALLPGQQRLIYVEQRYMSSAQEQFYGSDVCVVAVAGSVQHSQDESKRLKKEKGARDRRAIGLKRSLEARKASGWVPLTRRDPN